MSTCKILPPFNHQLLRHYIYVIYIQPGWINSLAKLTHIYMDNNKLSTFPAELCELKGLEVLCAPRNSITDIPSALTELKRLIQLNLSRNRIKNVPGGKLQNV